MIGLTLMGSAKTNNPFFEPYKNKYGAPPFDKIKNEHYMPAFKEGIRQHQAEINAIANNKNAATFGNTIAAMDYSGDLLKKVSSVFFNLYSAETNDGMAKIANEVSPILSEHNDNIYLNSKAVCNHSLCNHKRVGLRHFYIQYFGIGKFTVDVYLFKSIMVDIGWGIVGKSIIS